MKIKLSIKSKVLLALLFAPLASLLIIMPIEMYQRHRMINEIKVTALQTFRQMSVNEMNAFGQLISQFFIKEIAQPLYQQDFEAVQKSYQHLLENPAISYVTIYDSTGVIFRDGVKEEGTIKVPVQFSIAYKGTILELEGPIRHEDKLIGGFSLGFALDKMEQAHGGYHDFLAYFIHVLDIKSRYSLFFLTLTAVILLAFLAVRMGKHLTDPIVAITDYAKKVSEGIRDVAAPKIEGDDELQQLGQAVVKMASDLSRSVSELEKSNDGLERKVRERTQELCDLQDQIIKRLSVVDATDGPVDLRETLKQSLAILPHIETQIFLASEMPTVEGNENKIQQLFVALASTAKDGKLSVSSHVDKEAGCVKVRFNESVVNFRIAS